MNQREIYITEFDLARLRDVLKTRISAGARDRSHLESLENELDRAHVVDPSAVPHDVVTMNSQAWIEDVDTGMENAYMLVFPSDADIPEKKLSILAPIGTALLEGCADETVDWLVPAGMRTVRIKEVLYQPEAAGDFHR